MWLPVMSESKRLYVMLGGGIVAILIAGLLYWVTRPADPVSPDSELAAVNEMAKAGDAEGLKRSVKSSNKRTAARAVQAYAQLSGAQGRTFIQQQFSDPRAEVRSEAAMAWAYVGTRQEVRPLLTLIAADAAPDVRMSGLHALASLRAWDGLPTVLDRMDRDTDPAVRQAAMAAFEQVAHLRIAGQYDPTAAPGSQRAVISQLRAFVARPEARQMYQEWVGKQASSR